MPGAGWRKLWRFARKRKRSAGSWVLVAILAYCYREWGLLAREQRDRNEGREKLAAALDIFTELNMPA
jgi:hypothetical protein